MEEVHCVPFSPQPTGTPSHVESVVRQHQVCSGARGSNLMVGHGICPARNGQEVWPGLLLGDLVHVFFSFFLYWSLTPVISPMYKYRILQYGPPLVTLHVLPDPVGAHGKACTSCIQDIGACRRWTEKQSIGWSNEGFSRTRCWEMSAVAIFGTTSPLCRISPFCTLV